MPVSRGINRKKTAGCQVPDLRECRLQSEADVSGLCHSYLKMEIGNQRSKLRRGAPCYPGHGTREQEQRMRGQTGQPTSQHKSESSLSKCTDESS